MSEKFHLVKICSGSPVSIQPKRHRCVTFVLPVSEWSPPATGSPCFIYTEQSRGGRHAWLQMAWWQRRGVSHVSVFKRFANKETTWQQQSLPVAVVRWLISPSVRRFCEMFSAAFLLLWLRRYSLLLKFGCGLQTVYVINLSPSLLFSYLSSSVLLFGRGRILLPLPSQRWNDSKSPLCI